MVTLNFPENPVDCTRAALTRHLHVKYVDLDWRKRGTFLRATFSLYTPHLLETYWLRRDINRGRKLHQNLSRIIMSMRTWKLGGASLQSICWLDKLVELVTVIHSCMSNQLMMNFSRLLLLLAVLVLELCTAQFPDEPCVTNAYPPDPR